MNKTYKIILIFLLTAAFCGSLVAGTAYALLADGTTNNIAVSSGTVNVTVSVPSFSFYYNNGDGIDDRWPQGGVGLFDDELVISKMKPGCIVSIDVHVKNVGTLAAKWQLQLTSSSNLFENVTLSTNEELEFVGTATAMLTAWQHIDATSDGKPVERTVTVYFSLPMLTNDVSVSGNVSVFVNAVQGNAPTVNP